MSEMERKQIDDSIKVIEAAIRQYAGDVTAMAAVELLGRFFKDINRIADATEGLT